MSEFIHKIQHIEYLKEKKRFLLFVVVLFFTLFLAVYLLRIAYARYEMKARINAEIDKAIYILDEESVNFNLEPEGIIPSSTPYTYRFSVSNFKDDKVSDVDYTYSLMVRTTTNLPITMELYRNELNTDPGAVNMFSGALERRDEDRAWYKLYKPTGEFEMYYENKTTDIYTLVINFPELYANDADYANYLESIEVIIESKQMV